MLKEHEIAADGAETIYHEFLLWYKRGKREVYAIVEGDEDPIFYRGVVENILPDGWNVRTIAAGRKDKVLGTLASMDWSRFSTKRICFFVDRDLSTFLGGQVASEHGNLYVTDKYSLENEIANESTLLRALREIMGVANISPDEEEVICEAYRQSFIDFSEAFSVVMAQIVSWMRAKKSPCLKNIDPSVMFRFNGELVQLKHEFLPARARVEYAAQQVGQQPDDQDVLDAVLEEFLQANGSQAFVRGKYVFWFFTKSVLQFHANIGKYCGTYPAPPRAKVAFGPKNAMAVLAGKARCWASLREFIEGNFVAHTAAHG